jgi:arabinan endo-1,5-alpha-L-arabinosidase
LKTTASTSRLATSLCVLALGALLALPACNGSAIGDGAGGSGPGVGGAPATGSGGAPATGSGGATSGSGGTPVSGTGGGSAGRGAGGAVGAGGAPVIGLGGFTGNPDTCVGAAYDPAQPPTPLALTGNLGAHDPAAIVVGDTIYLAATGLGSKTSTNMTAWANGGNPLARPAWVTGMVPGATNLWAPDISFFGGMFHLYYAASTFGSNRSCIGHATRASMSAGAWADSGGPTICSNVGTTDNWNAIDPNVIVDDTGVPWMAFGSFWGGLKMIKLTDTGARADTTLLSIAARPRNGGALEGGWVFKHCGYYYLFSSWGSCCSGAYDYNMRVGRSTSVSGPYVDKAGVALMDGGGTLLVQGNATMTAPGHNAVIAYQGKTYNLYHVLNATHGGAALRISELVWDADGWPISGGP